MSNNPDYGIRNPCTEGTVIQCYEWTKEPPTKKGWYWHLGSHRFDTIEAVKVDIEEDVLGVWRSGNWDEFYSCEKEGGYWLGPIPAPLKPNDA